jgi:transposase
LTSIRTVTNQSTKPSKAAATGGRREKFTCRDCEKINQAPAPFHAIARGWAGPSLLAMVLFEKFGQHQPLNRQAERYAKEGVPISLSTLADQVGGCTAALTPLFTRFGIDNLAELIQIYR